MKTILYICLVLFLGACSPQSTNPPKVQASVSLPDEDTVVTGFTTEWEGKSLSNGEYEYNCDCKKDSLKYGFSSKTVLAYFESYFDREYRKQYMSDSAEWCFGLCYMSVLDAYFLQTKKHPDELHFRTIAKICQNSDGEMSEYMSFAIGDLIEDNKVRPKFMDFVYQKANRDSNLLYITGFYWVGNSPKENKAIKNKLFQEGKKRKTLNKKVLDFLFALANEEG